MSQNDQESFPLREAEYKAEIGRLKAIAESPTGVGRVAEHVSSEIAGTDLSEDPFFAAVKATRMPMVVADPRRDDLPIVFCNDSFCRLTGYAREEILGRNCRFLQCAETDPATVARLRAALSVPEPIEIDIRNARKDGTLFWNRLLMAPVHAADGTLTYFFASQVDVTLERERLEGLESHNAALLVEVTGRRHAQHEIEDKLRVATEAGRLGVWDLEPADANNGGVAAMQRELRAPPIRSLHLRRPAGGRAPRRPGPPHSGGRAFGRDRG